MQSQMISIDQTHAARSRLIKNKRTIVLRNVLLWYMSVDPIEAHCEPIPPKIYAVLLFGAITLGTRGVCRETAEAEAAKFDMGIYVHVPVTKLTTRRLSF